MAGLPVNQQCMYNDPSVYVKTEYDQGKILIILGILTVHLFKKVKKVSKVKLSKLNMLRVKWLKMDQKGQN